MLHYKCSSMKFLVNTVLILLLIPALSFGQKKMKSFSNAYVPAGGFMSIFGDYEFSGAVNTGNLKTSRLDQKGFINFVEGSKWMGQADNQFIDGYVCVHHNNAFTFPIGHENVYAPIAVSGAVKTAAAFFNNNPQKINGFKTNLSSDLGKISEIGYWDIIGPNSSKITLAYNESFNITDITEGDLNSLTIVGLQGNEWNVISSTIDNIGLNTMSSTGSFKVPSDLKVGSITTDEEINPGDYDFFALASITNKQLLSDIEFSVFPNPSISGADINIEYELPSNGSIQIFNSANELMFNQNLDLGSGQFSLKKLELHEGTYFVSFIDGEGFVKSKKLIIVSN